MQSDKAKVPIVISNRIAQGYIQAAFVTAYPPALLQNQGLRYNLEDYPPALHPHAQPIGFGPFLFEDFEAAWQGYPSAIFVVTELTLRKGIWSRKILRNRGCLRCRIPTW